ncbi:MAG: hypothetical protein EHM58_09275 [Ignavibacteriae bacterium]|nr:MAG: hypothetical protein EHM58_09275 [Ignavibacteriota bacterium]
MNIKNYIYTISFLVIALLFNACKSDTTEPINSSGMSLVATANTPGYAQDVVIYQQGINYAFIADDNSGLQIINVSNPSVPIYVTGYNTAGNASDVKVASINGRAYAFVADGTAGWSIIDVDQPSQPFLDTVITFSNDNVICSFIELSTRRAYIGTYNRMYIYDISTLPNAVTQLSSYYSADNLNAIWAEGGVAYLAQNTAGVELVNVVNPSYPAYISAFNTPGYAMDIDIAEGHYAYIADWNSMIVIDVVNPFNPVPVGTYYNTNSQFTALTYNNNGVFYSAEGPQGIETIGVGTPTSPVQLGYYNTTDFAGGVAASGNYVFVADGNSGLVILSYTTK